MELKMIGIGIIQKQEMKKLSFSKKIFLFLLYIILFSIGKVFSNECKLNNSAYSVDYKFWDREKLETNKRYPLVYFDEYILDYKDQSFVLSIKNDNSSLCYDITSLIFGDHIPLALDYISFFIQNNFVNVLFERSDLKCFFIKYDFDKGKVDIKTLGILSDLFYYMSQKGIEITPDDIIKYFDNQKIKLDYCKFNYEGNDFCNFFGNYDFIPEITISDSVNIKINNKNGEYYVKKVPESIYAGTCFITDKLIQQDVVYTTNSFLTEGLTKYVSGNLKEFSDIPWCPSIPYQKEVITIKTKKPIEGLYIGNGFYRTDKNYLYQNNCRVKELEILFLESHNIQKVTLEDSGYLQFVPLINVNEKNIEIRIFSVYEGDKYSDLCINCILPLRRWGWNEYISY